MKKLKFLPLLLIIPLLIFPKVVINSAREGLNVWARNILPSLFPFAILSSAITMLYSGGKCGKLLKKISDFLKISPYALRCILIGAVSGYPIGAMTVNQSYKNGEIEADKLSLYAGMASLCSPMFLIATVGEGMLSNVFSGVMLLVIHYVSYIAAFAIFSVGRKNTECKVPAAFESQKQSLGAILKASVDKASSAMISVCGYVVVFRVILGIIELLPVPHIFQSVIAVILEMSVGCALASSAALLLPIKMSLISFCTSWGGVCVNLQINSYVVEGTKPMRTVLFKLTHGVISGIISFAFWSICSV